MLPAPQGSHYSITAGERSEPAEAACPTTIGPKGVERSSCVGVPRCHPFGWQLSVCLFALFWGVRLLSGGDTPSLCGIFP